VRCRDARERAHDGGYGPIINQLTLKVHISPWSFHSARSGDMNVFRLCAATSEIGLGLRGVTQVALIPIRYDCFTRAQDLSHIAREGLLKSQMGFAPGYGALVRLDEAYRKALPISTEVPG